MSHKQDLLDVHKLHKVNMLFLTRSLFHAKTMTVPIHIEIFHHQPRCRKNTCQALVVHQATPWGQMMMTMMVMVMVLVVMIVIQINPNNPVYSLQ